MKDLNWVALFKKNLPLLMRYLAAGLHSHGIRMGHEFTEFPRGSLLRPNRSGPARGDRSTASKRPRQARSSSSQGSRAPQIGGGSSTSKLYCNSRKDPIFDACEHQPECKFYHGCPCHPGQFHSAAECNCKVMGKWDSALVGPAIILRKGAGGKRQ